jgi:hypothetical protein
VNETQDRVAQRLALLGPGPAGFYREACRLVEELVAGVRPLTTVTHVVSHLLREVDSSVRQVLVAQLAEQRPVVATEPPEALEPGRAVPPPPALESTAVVRRADFGGTEDECEEDGVGHAMQVAGIIRALGLPENGPEHQQWRALGRGDGALHKRAHRDDLSSPRPADASFLSMIEGVTRLFDVVLDRFASHYAAVYAGLDVLLAREQPTRRDLRTLKSSIPNTQHTLSYFFGRLQHLGWLDQLERAGYFRSPPPPEVNAERGTLAYPHWAALDYLERVAAAAPARVAAILADVPETGNVRVRTRIIEVLLALRAEDRLAAVSRVTRWAEHLAQHHWGDQLPRFALQLVHDGAVDAAFSLTEVMLEARNSDGTPVPRRRAGYTGERARAWHLRGAAESLFPALIRADAHRAIRLLAYALDLHAGRGAEDTDAPADTPEGLMDYSSLWADDLGEQEQLDASDLRVFLTHLTRLAVRQVGVDSPGELAGVVGLLRTFGARVLRRLELAALADVLRSENQAARDAARPLALLCLTTTAMLHEGDLDREMGLLLVAFMSVAMPAERQQVLDALQPPPFDWIKREEDAAARRAQWRRDRLALVSALLSARERGELAAIITTEGTPEPLAHSGPRMSTFSDRPSPLDDQVLRTMEVGELLGFLGAWRPEAGFDAPSRAGLASRIESMVKEDPVRYTSWAPQFIGQHPAYVVGLLDGFRAAARSDATFRWNDVLTLMTWVAEQAPSDDMPRQVPGDPAGGATNGAASQSPADWRQAKQVAAGMVGLALGRAWDDPDALPWEERERVWAIIEALAEDPNPTPAYEARWGGTNMDPATVAINTVRPEAIDAAVRFAFWSAQHRARANAGLRDVLVAEPEVAALLERHLDPAVDPSLAVRAAIGRWLTPLARTDARWVEAHLVALLPQAADDSSDDARRRDALWDAFTQWSEPHPDALPALAASYRAAIERVGHARPMRKPEAPDDRLAEHVVALYWWDAVQLDQEDSLIVHLFARGDARRRAHALHHVGFSMYHRPGPVEQEVLIRLQRLWDWRAPALIEIVRSGRDAVGAAAVAAARKELETFGWWFACGAFDAVWSLERLESVLREVGSIEMEHAVAEQLSEVAPEHPLLAVTCLLHVDFTGGENPWSVRNWLEHLEAVIRAARASGDEDASRTARDVLNRVIAAGHTEHRDLLVEPPPDQRAT